MNTAKFKHTDPRGERAKVAPDINRSELARSIGVGRAHLSRIMSGKIRPNVDTLRKLACALGTNLDGADRFLNGLNAERE